MDTTVIARLLFCALFVVSSLASSAARHSSTSGLVEQGSQVVQLLGHFAGAYWARVAGRDTGLPPHVNGHDEFVAEWTRDMLSALHDLPVGVVLQPFKTPGFRTLPARRDGANVAVVVPGSQHPNLAAVVGAHPDGEPFSKGSAYDDTSGSVIMIGLARSLGRIWRAHGLPSLTVEFALFDAEEEGLVGSNAFAFAYRHGALMPKPVFMIDEEQSGVGYPVRPFGRLSEDPLKSYATTTGRVPPRVATWLGPTLQPDEAALALATKRLEAARSSAFAQLHGEYGALAYRGGDASAFAPGDGRYLEIGPLSVCCSDNAPFEALGLPTVTFSGDSDFYAHDAPPWSFPFDQPEDTPQLLACDTGGVPQPTDALAAALELPLLLSQQVIADYAPPGKGAGLAVFSTVPAVGSVARFQVVGASRAQWSFGDGGQATGTQVSHSYKRQGAYLLRVLSAGQPAAPASLVPGHETSTSVRVHVAKRPAVFVYPFRLQPPPRRPWSPAPLHNVPGCHSG